MKGSRRRRDTSSRSEFAAKWEAAFRKPKKKKTKKAAAPSTKTDTHKSAPPVTLASVLKEKCGLQMSLDFYKPRARTAVFCESLLRELMSEIRIYASELARLREWYDEQVKNIADEAAVKNDLHHRRVRLLEEEVERKPLTPAQERRQRRLRWANANRKPPICVICNTQQTDFKDPKSDEYWCEKCGTTLRVSDGTIKLEREKNEGELPLA